MSRFGERWLPTLLGLVAAAACWWLFGAHGVTEKLTELFAGTLSLSAIIAGFLATTKSILFSLPDSRRLYELQKAGAFQHLVECIMSSVRWSLALAVLSAAGLLFRETPYVRHVLTVWSAAAVASTSSYYIVATMLASLLRSRQFEKGDR